MYRGGGGGFSGGAGPGGPTPQTNRLAAVGGATAPQKKPRATLCAFVIIAGVI